MKKHALAVLSLTALLLGGCAAESENAADSALEEQWFGSEQESEAAETDTEIGESELPPLSAFTAQTINGAEINETELARADVTVINIWSTTCPPCIREMPELAEFAAQLPENVQLMTWCLDGSYETAAAKEILADAGFSGITIVQGDGDLNRLGGKLMYTPTTIFLDSEGNMACEEIIGAYGIADSYTAHINAALRKAGKPELE